MSQQAEASVGQRALVILRQVAGVATRLVQAEKTRTARTPPRGRGKRQSTEHTTLLEALAHVLKRN